MCHCRNIPNVFRVIYRGKPGLGGGGTRGGEGRIGKEVAVDGVGRDV